MALSSAQRQLINESSPINKQFSIGSRLEYLGSGGPDYLQTAGTLSSGTLSQCDLASGYHNDITIQSFEWYTCTGAACDKSTTTGVTKVSSGGHYKWSSTDGSVIRVATDVPDDDIVWIANMATLGVGGGTGQVSLCTDKSVYYASSTSASKVQIAAGQTWIAQKCSAHWIPFQASAYFASWATDATSS